MVCVSGHKFTSHLFVHNLIKNCLLQILLTKVTYKCYLFTHVNTLSLYFQCNHVKCHENALAVDNFASHSFSWSFAALLMPYETGISIWLNLAANNLLWWGLTLKKYLIQIETHNLSDKQSKYPKQLCGQVHKLLLNNTVTMTWLFCCCLQLLEGGLHDKF